MHLLLLHHHGLRLDDGGSSHLLPRKKKGQEMFSDALPSSPPPQIPDANRLLTAPGLSALAPKPVVGRRWSPLVGTPPVGALLSFLPVFLAG